MEKETPASTPRGVLPALLERRAPWLLGPTRKTLVWGAPPCELDAWELDGSGHSSPSISVGTFVGFFDVLRNNASHARLYRDCSAADLAFTAFRTVLTAYAAWHARSSHSSRPTRRASAGSSALLAGMLVHRHPPALPPRRLRTLRAPRCHHHANGAAPCALHAAARRTCGSPHAPALEADAGLLDARVVHRKRQWI
ncbi:hypothetical protein FB451DRAFT_1417159 [Mycena latifolia]|nr:hypothetical protein FB451DRAFT_1417159 [Mycena latifolia]